MPDFIESIRQAVALDNYVMTHHAVEQMGLREVLETEVVETVLHGETIEQNPRARPLPKCLFMHPVRPGEPLYVACAYNARQNSAVIITVHWYDPDKWIDWRTRR